MKRREGVCGEEGGRDGTACEGRGNGKLSWESVTLIPSSSVCCWHLWIVTD